MFIHKNNVHDRHECNICEYKSFRKTDLKIHIRDVHGSKEKIQCKKREKEDKND